MKAKEIHLPLTFYQKFLQEIGGIKFTHREVTLLACFISGRSAKTVASFLSVSPKTIETHTRNIMLKLECNSREQIIDFLETTEQYNALKNYYQHLLVQISFHKMIAELKGKTTKKYCTLLWDRNATPPLLQQLVKDLKLVNVYARIQCRPPLSHKEDVFEVGIDDEYLIINSQAYPYYLAFFEILSRLYPKLSLRCYIADFEKRASQRESEGRPYTQKPQRQTNLRQIWKISTAVFVLSTACLLILGLFILNRKPLEGATRSPHKIIRSDLLLSHQMSILKRHQLVQTIDEKFNQQKGIQIVALVGIGGSGKTTLARQYAKSQKAPVSWEINAETKESLVSSFEDLARALAQTEEHRIELRAIQEIQDSHEKEKSLFLMVKRRLQAYPGWLLIYDNIEKFNDIRKYFPLDSRVWGTGRIILTTRDNNIQNIHIMNAHQVVNVHALGDEEKFQLYSLIVNGGQAGELTADQKKNILNFLKQIPPFPLDIATAAYYIKDTQISHQNYLRRTKKMGADFVAAQESLLKEATDYPRSRYGVITLTLEKLIDEHKDFKVLLLFISLIDSQNIPKNLLEHCAKNTTAEQFIHSLRRHSLITKEIPFDESTAFSIHRSLQEISLNYLTYGTEFEANKHLLIVVKQALREYVSYIIDSEDVPKLKILIRHCQALVGNEKLLKNINQESLNIELGILYFYVGDYLNAERLLNESLQSLPQLDHHRSYKVFQALLHLGIIYRAFGNYQKAIESLNRGLELQRKYFSERKIKMALALVHLGKTYRCLGDYEKAKDLMKKSLQIYKEHLEGNNLSIAWVYTSLGTTYRYLSDYEYSKFLLEKGLKIYKRHYGTQHVRVAWSMASLGNVYKNLQRYDEATQLLKKSLQIYRANYGNSHIRVAWVLLALGNVYRYQGNYQKALDLIKKSIRIYESLYGEDNIKVARAKVHLGRVFKNMQNQKMAKSLFDQALTTYKDLYGEGRARISWNLIQFGKLYRNWKKYEKSFVYMQQGLDNYVRQYGEDHLITTWAKIQLGKVYIDRGEISQAKSILENAVNILQKQYGDTHLETIRATCVLGKAYLAEKNFLMAKKLFTKCLKNLQKNEHPCRATVLFNLAELFMIKSQNLLQHNKVKKSQRLNLRSKKLLQESRAILIKNYDKNSIKITRVNNLLKEVT